MTAFLAMAVLDDGKPEPEPEVPQVVYLIEHAYSLGSDLRLYEVT